MARQNISNVAQQATNEIIDMLSADHAKLLQLFEHFQEIKSQADDETRQTLVEIACTELVIHAQIEEEYLYPLLCSMFKDTELIDEAEVEHALTKTQIAELELMQPGDDLYDAKFTVLGEYVRHHIHAEENKIFPQFLVFSGSDEDPYALQSLARDLRHRRDVLRSEFGFPDADYEETVAEALPPSGTKPASPHHRPP